MGNLRKTINFMKEGSQNREATKKITQMVPKEPLKKSAWKT